MSNDRLGFVITAVLSVGAGIVGFVYVAFLFIGGSW